MHDLTKLSYERIEARLDDLAETRANGTYWVIECQCDDFEVDDLVMVRDCAWNDETRLANELTKRGVK